MMKKCAIACSAIFFLSFHASAQTYLHCDFSRGIPDGFTLIDNDALEPSAAMRKEGFAVGTPWIAQSPKGEDNPAACSTSWYAEKGTSDDWMITPPFTVSSAGSVLTWRAMASDKRNRDGYAVYVSTSAATDVDGFDRTAPLFSVGEEENAWTKHSVSLDGYVGQTITVAFVNNSTDKSRLYVDDIAAGVHSRVLCRLTTPTGVPSVGETAVSGVAYTDDDAAVEGFDVTLSYGGESFTQHFTETIAPGAPVAFTLDRKIALRKYQPQPYTVEISSGTDRFAAQGTLTAYERKVLCEEGTGTWCGFCVRGLVYVDSLKEHATNWAIPIAAHQGDPMENEYVSAIERWLGDGGFPAGSVNRAAQCDPSDFFNYGRALFDREKVLVDIALSAALDPASRLVQTSTTLHFADAATSANYALAYAVIENNVHRPGDAQYQQHNSYANGERGPMGGYERYGEYIPSEVMYYQCVARGYIDDINGVEGSVPTSFGADEPIVYEKSFPLPDKILDDRNTALVVMLIDRADNHVVNAQQVPLGANEVDGIASPSPHRRPSGTAAFYRPDGTRTASLRRGLNIVRTADGRVVKVAR